jgi:TPR repeat protein
MALLMVNNNLLGKRVALVIGNSAYIGASVLPNARNDALDIAAALTRVGFSGVNQGESGFACDFKNAQVNANLDLNRNQMLDAIAEFAIAAQRSQQAFVYFAGHGIETEGQNYLVPIDAVISHEQLIGIRAASLAQLLGAIDGSRELSLVVLDACRDNPIKELRSNRRSLFRGLGAVEPSGNTVVFYAAKHGTAALDNVDKDAKNSPFAKSILTHIEKPGLDVGDLFRKVKDEVWNLTLKRQEPQQYGSLGDSRVYLVPPRTPVNGKNSGEARHMGRVDDETKEHTYWQSIMNDRKPVVFEDFISRFPTGTYSSIAGSRAEDCIKQCIDASALEQMLDLHATSPRREIVLNQLASLHWATLSQSFVIADLDAFAIRFPACEEARLATQKSVALRWDKVKRTENIELLREFADKFGNHQEANFARAQLLKLTKEGRGAWPTALVACAATIIFLVSTAALHRGIGDVAEPNAAPNEKPPIQEPEVGTGKGLNAEQLFQKGYAFDIAVGVPQYLTEAAKWYKLAVNKGHPGAHRKLAELYLGRGGVLKNPHEARRLFLIAANQGDAQAQFIVGRDYSENKATKIMWLRSAAEKGNAEATSLLATLEPPQNSKKPNPSSVPTASKAEESIGNVLNAEQLFQRGYTYDIAVGVRQDLAEAAKWYKLAVNEGHPGAHRKLAELYLGRGGFTVDKIAAERLYRTAAMQGDAEAQFIFAKLYINDRAAKIEWLRSSAKKGNTAAAKLLEEFESDIALPKLVPKPAPRPAERETVSSNIEEKALPELNALNMSDQAARKKLEALWDKGRLAAKRGNDQIYFLAMLEARDLAKAQFGPESPEYANANNHMIGAFTGVGKMQEAIEAAKHAIRVNSILYGPNSKNVAVDKANLAARLGSTGKVKEAEMMYIEVLSVYAKSEMTGDDIRMLAHAFEGYSQVLAMQDRLSEALEFANKAVTEISQPRFANAIDLGWILANHAHILRQSGDCSSAKTAFEKAAKAFKGAGVPAAQRDHADSIRLANQSC